MGLAGDRPKDQRKLGCKLTVRELRVPHKETMVHLASSQTEQFHLRVVFMITGNNMRIFKSHFGLEFSRKVNRKLRGLDKC